jgi:2-methylcitrate dehydratase PrpD
MKTLLSRRHLLQSGGAALAVIPMVAQAAPAISPITESLSSYMSSAGARPLPADVAEKTKQHILDTFAAMISGATLPPGRFDLKFARQYGGGNCTVVASQILCGPMEAAMINALLAHSDETDDSHPGSESHPGSSVVPAAFATGEQFGGDGAAFLRAVALGYDIGPRFGAALGKIEYMVESHRSTHALSGLFGAVAAAGSMATLDARQMRWLLSYAAQQASGLASWQRDVDHIEKAFDFAGMSARNGVTAALLVKAGATGVDDVLAGNDNFFEAFKPLRDPSMVVDGLGTRYEVLNTSIKKWTVGSPIQAPLDALQSLMQAHRFTAEQVKTVTVRVAAGEATIVDNRAIPDICLQHMLAVMLVDGTASFASAHDVPRMQDPQVLRQRAKITLVHDDDLQKLMPARVAVVEVALNDGTNFSQRVASVKGTAQNPMSHDELVAKARDLMAPVLGDQRCTRLIDAIFGLEQVTSLSQLRPLLQKA